MLAAVKESLFTPLALENVEAFSKGQAPKNVINMYFYKCVGNSVVQEQHEDLLLRY